MWCFFEILSIFHTLPIGIGDDVARTRFPLERGSCRFYFPQCREAERERGRGRNKRCTLAQLYRNPCKFIPLLSKDFVLPWSSIFLLVHPSPLHPLPSCLPRKKIDLACRASSFFLSISLLPLSSLSLLPFLLSTKQTTTRSCKFAISRPVGVLILPIIDRSCSIRWNNR